MIGHAMCAMCAMPAMQTPGGGAMSMWMRMPGQTWPGVAAAFLAMWTAMMVAMMLPSLAPMLWRYRQTLGRMSGGRLAAPTALVGAGYFLVWVVVGMVVFPVGVALAALVVRQPALARAEPLAAGVAVTVAGALQFTSWKRRHLACCRETSGPDDVRPGDGVAALRHGLRRGLHCGRCCINLMAISLVLGVMDLSVMAAVTAAITAERLAPAGDRVAAVTGAVAVGAGLCLIARAAGVP